MPLLIRQLLSFLLPVLLGLLAWGVTPAAAGTTLVADPARAVELLPGGQLYQANGTEPPAQPQQLQAWLAALRPVPQVSLWGGRYWLHAQVRNDSAESRWVVAPYGSVIEHIQVRVQVPGQAPQRTDTGYLADDATFPLHYGAPVTLPPGAVAQVLVRLDSRYFARFPGVALQAEADYRRTVLMDNTFILGALGAIVTLALYNLFVFMGTRERALLYYALYLLAAAVGWGLTFHLGAHALGWRDLRWHYVGFFLLPVFNGLFVIEFLQLQRLAPRLARATRGSIVLSLALLPTCFVSPALAHAVMAPVVSTSLLLAVVSGWTSMATGFAPARYFLAAFVGLVLPALVLMPSTLGLMQSPMRNPELLMLLGCLADALLLAFALADKVRLLARQKDEALRRLDGALALARTDHLTGLSNRHAFDLRLDAALATMPGTTAAPNLLLAVIDLDGLKHVNDTQGHARGDALLCRFAQLLATLGDDRTAVFRLGGDEFALLGDERDGVRLRAALEGLEQRLQAAGFPGCGVSFGVALAQETPSARELVRRADRRMYRHKAGKPRGAAQRAVAVSGSAAWPDSVFESSRSVQLPAEV